MTPLEAKRAQHTLHLTRAFGAPLYRGFLQSFVGLFRAVVVQTRRGQVSSDERRELTARFASSLVLFSATKQRAQYHRPDTRSIRTREADEQSLNQTLLLSVQLRFDGNQGHRYTFVHTFDPQGRLARAVMFSDKKRQS